MLRGGSQAQRAGSHRVRGPIVDVGAHSSAGRGGGDAPSPWAGARGRGGVGGGGAGTREDRGIPAPAPSAGKRSADVPDKTPNRREGIAPRPPAGVPTVRLLQDDQTLGVLE